MISHSNPSHYLGTPRRSASASLLRRVLFPYCCSSSCAITYFLAANPSVQRKLQAELDQFLGSADAVSSYDEVKHLKYLDVVIKEGLRIHSTSALGLPRVVSSGGMEVEGHVYPEGTVLSVPTYTIHRDVDVWGKDAEDFRPERWFERDASEMAKTFNPFSYGPR
jgi:benzoate 4-monooxygenase